MMNRPNLTKELARKLTLAELEARLRKIGCWMRSQTSQRAPYVIEVIRIGVHEFGEECVIGQAWGDTMEVTVIDALLMAEDVDRRSR
jgi:hypothetical protein